MLETAAAAPAPALALAAADVAGAETMAATPSALAASPAACPPAEREREGSTVGEECSEVQKGGAWFVERVHAAQGAAQFTFRLGNGLTDRHVDEKERRVGEARMQRMLALSAIACHSNIRR